MWRLLAFVIFLIGAGEAHQVRHSIVLSLKTCIFHCFTTYWTRNGLTIQQRTQSTGTYVFPSILYVQSGSHVNELSDQTNLSGNAHPVTPTSVTNIDQGCRSAVCLSVTWPVPLHVETFALNYMGIPIYLVHYFFFLKEIPEEIYYRYKM